MAKNSMARGKAIAFSVMGTPTVHPCEGVTVRRGALRLITGRAADSGPFRGRVPVPHYAGVYHELARQGPQVLGHPVGRPHLPPCLFQAGALSVPRIWAAANRSKREWNGLPDHLLVRPSKVSYVGGRDRDGTRRCSVGRLTGR